MFAIFLEAFLCVRAPIYQCDQICIPQFSCLSQFHPLFTCQKFDTRDAYEEKKQFLSVNDAIRII